MISQWSRNTFLCKIFKHFILIKTATGSNLVSRTKRQYTLLQKSLTVCRENLNLGINERGYSLYIGFFTDVDYRVNILESINARNNIFICRKIKCGGCCIIIGCIDITF